MSKQIKKKKEKKNDPHVVYGEGRVHEDEGVGDAELRVLCSCCIIKEIQKR